LPECEALVRRHPKAAGGRTRSQFTARALDRSAEYRGGARSHVWQDAIQQSLTSSGRVSWPMIHVNGMAHVILTVASFDGAAGFYDRLLPFLGLGRVFKSDKFASLVPPVGLEPTLP